MARLDRLQPDHVARMLEIRSHWHAVVVATNPIDRWHAEESVRRVYLTSGLAPPGEFRWVASPILAIRELLLRLNKGQLSAVDDTYFRLQRARGAVLQRIASASAIGPKPRLELTSIFAADRWLERWAVIGQRVGEVFSRTLPIDPLGSRVAGASSHRSLDGNMTHCLLRPFPGQHESMQFALHDGLLGLPLCGLPQWTADAYKAWRRCAELGWWWPQEKFVLFSERPSIVALDDRENLHSDTGPALVYADDQSLSIWAIHGVRVARHVVESPDRITATEIDGEANAERKRILIERYGEERYLLDTGYRIIHRDDWGTLFQRDRPDYAEPLVMLKVVNSTPEPDGSFKDYFLRVPPGMTTARQAVAWTFGKSDELDYAPSQET